NGYSLARKVLFAHHDVREALPSLDGEVLGEALLRVHRSYLQPIQNLIGADLAHAFAHITGGGLEGNLARVIPEGLQAHVDYDAWPRPALFRLIQEEGGVPEDDLRRALNLGIGLVAVVPADRAREAEQVLREGGEAPVHIGQVDNV
ncbi:MAG: AIR synthase-related protein, partial [Rhodothermales bacterium]